MNKTIFWVLVGLGAALTASFLLGLPAGMAGADPGFTPVLVGMIFGAFVAYIGGNLAGNRKTKTADGDTRSRALSLVAEPGHGLMIVMREGFVGMAAGMNVMLDGMPVAQLKSPRFTAIRMTPGDHVVSMAFGGLAAVQNHAVEERFNVIQGGVVAYRATMAMGAVKNSIRIERLEPDDDLLAKLRAMKMTASDQVAV